MRKRILYLIGDMRMGGAQRQLVYLVRNLDTTRFEPVVCCLSNDTPLTEELRAAGVEVIILPQWLRPDVSRLWRVPQIVKRVKPDLIHAYLFVANTWGRTTALLCGLPVIVSERNAVERKNLAERLVNRLLAPFTTLLIANSHAGAEMAVRQKEVAPDRVQVIHNGIVLEPFHDPAIGYQVRQELGIEPNQLVVGIVGRLALSKDHETFFRAMRLVVAQMPSIRILCVGDGAKRQELVQLVAALDLQAHVTFAGHRKDIPAVMFALDVLVSSSQWEGLPNVIMEAMAAERPIVATDVGDVAVLVDHQRSGLLVQPGDPEALAQAVVALLQDESRRLEMGKQGRLRVEQQFTHDQMVAATSAVYHQLLGQG